VLASPISLTVAYTLIEHALPAPCPGERRPQPPQVEVTGLMASSAEW
jgi:hypothetical protein